jgi:predicted amidohydrolase YtcJ
MQAVHCTSDAVFVPKRLGHRRSKEGAYVWKSLLNSGAVVTNGTDAPVERVDPIPSFYASVTRRLSPTVTFFPEQCLTREEGLKAYTIQNAYAAFEEDIKGSIEVGKLADFVILSNNLLECAEDEILKTKVVMTFVGGKVVFADATQPPASPDRKSPTTK